jgi:cephalosporin hydroxylase
MSTLELTSDLAVHRFDMSFGGHPMFQYWVDLLLWEALLNQYPQVTSICELGTAEGGFSWFLFAQAKARNLRFRTYDMVQPEHEPPSFQRMDVFLDKDKVLEWIGSEPTILLCDNGNKPRELRDYTPLLPDGSITVVHDWGTETLPSDVPDWLEEIHGDYCDALGSVSRVFRRREE